jgi:hypothetical protein
MIKNNSSILPLPSVGSCYQRVFTQLRHETKNN